MYIILEGEVKVYLDRKDRDIFLSNLGEGNFFGEMALFGIDERTASVEAKTDLKLLKIKQEDIRRLKVSNPEMVIEFLYALCAELCRRLSYTDESVESYYYINRAILRNQKFRDFIKKIWKEEEV